MAGLSACVRGWSIKERCHGSRDARHGVDYAAEYLQRFGFPAQNIVRTESLAARVFHPLQVARGYSVMANGGFLVSLISSAKSRTIRAASFFEERPKLPAQCNIPVIYGDTPKSDVLENKDVEDVATSQDPQNPWRSSAAAAGAGEPVAGGAKWRTGVCAARDQHPLAFLIKAP